jgi:hypothetical protein
MAFSWSFSRELAVLAYALLSISMNSSAVAADEKAIVVDLDYARVIKMPEGAQTLIIGNPLIADVTMLKNNQLLVVTGKSFGSTNLIVLDRAGVEVGESLIRVVPANEYLTVQRGPHRESYSCNPECLPAISMTDDRDYIQRNIDVMKLHEGSSAPTKR